MTKLSLLLVAAALPTAAFATVVTKSDSTGNLDLATSWNGGVAPTSTDIADFSGLYNTAGALSQTFTASTPVSWQGVSVGSLSGTAAGLVSIGGTGAATTGSQITLGSGGIDMSAANQNIVINAATLVIGSSQTWNVAAGRNLRFATSGTGSSNSNIDGGSGVVVTVQGGGVVDLNPGAGSAGLTGYAGKWIVGTGTTLLAIRNGSEALGSNTAADAITLQGGTLTVGGISGSQGNWAWNTTSRSPHPRARSSTLKYSPAPAAV
jgi:hypothetical protein